MARKAGEEPRFEFIPLHVLAMARKEEHAQYFKDVGLSDFVSQVPWSENQHHSTADMLELIWNFDRNLAKSRVKGMVISLSVESMQTMFRLEDGGQANVKISNYSPKSFSCDDRGKSNRAYPLQSCRDDVVKERLEFQLITLHMKGKRVETAALYQIQQVEEVVHADWGKCFTSRLVEQISKAQESLFQKKGKVVCAFASHLQVILSMAASLSPSVGSPFLVTMQPTFKQPIHTEQGIRAMCPKSHPEVVDTLVRDYAWTMAMHPISGKPVHTEQVGQGAFCSRQCMDIAEELKRDYALMTEGHKKMTTTVGELSKELGTLKAVCESLVTELYECRMKHLSKGKGNIMQASGPMDFDSANLALDEDTTVVGMIPLSSVEDNRVQTSALCIEDNGDDCNGNSTKNSKKRAMDSQAHEEITPSLCHEDNGAQWTGKVPNSKEDNTVADRGGIFSMATKACHNQPVKRTKLQQQKLSLLCVDVATHKPQPVNRTLDMNTKTDSTSLQSKKCRRARRKWSKEETDYLVSAVHRYGERWAIIVQAGIGILMGRNGGDCKDKWRNLNGGEY